MGALISLLIDLNKIDKSKIFNGKNGAKRYSLTIGVNDETSEYGNNVATWNEQTKEQREAKEKKTYLGNGKVIWTDGTIKTADKKEEPKVQENGTDNDLPF